MAKRRERAVKANAPADERDRKAIRSLLRKAGGGREELKDGREQLIQWIDEEIKRPLRARGRPRMDYFNQTAPPIPPTASYLNTVAETYGPAWSLDRASFIAVLKARGIKPPKGGFKFMTPTSTIRRDVQAIWDNHEKMSQDKSLSPQMRETWSTKHLGASVDAITRRLIKELRERGRLPTRRVLK